MAAKTLPDVAILRQLLDYDPDTGALTWRVRGREFFGTDAAHKKWNTRYAGAPALNCKRRGVLHGSVVGHSLLAHRVAWAVHYGFWPAGDIDHINGDPSDNRLENLRDVPHADNMKNMSRRIDNTSGVSGVSFQQSRRRWIAQISIAGQNRSLGVFASKQEAVAARQAAEVAFGFHKNHGRDRSQSR